MNYWTEGAKAFDAGIPMADNPYPQGSHPFIRWSDGWIDAWYEYAIKG